MYDKAERLVRKFMEKHEKMPNAIFLGHKEYDQASIDCRAVSHSVSPDFKTFMGLELFEVNKSSCLKVGIVEGD